VAGIQPVTRAIAAVPREAGTVRGARPVPAILLKAGGGLVLLVLWEVVVRALAPAYVARPTGIARVFFSVLFDEKFLADAAATLWAVAEGLFISLIAGTLVGVAMGRIAAVEQGLRYYVNSLFATPMVAILPLVTLWFGYNGDARLAVVVFASFFSIVINCCDGARSVPLDYIEVARSFRARPLSTLFDVLLPSSLPYLLAGIRLAAGRALIGAVVSEFFVSIPGLGFYILYNSRIFKHNEAFVAVIVLVAVGVGFDAFVNWLTRRYMPWGRRG
jgi:ABC-type nitrate/sulfonate/bicarbonate transport system permease component